MATAENHTMHRRKKSKTVDDNEKQNDDSESIVTPFSPSSRDNIYEVDPHIHRHANSLVFSAPTQVTKPGMQPIMQPGQVQHQYRYSTTQYTQVPAAHPQTLRRTQSQ